MTNIGDRLRQYREDAGLSRYELAVQAGVHPETVENIEKERVKHPRWLTIRLLARRLGIDALDLAGNVQQEQEGCVADNVSKYQVEIEVNEVYRIIRVDCRTAELPGKILSFETAWASEDPHVRDVVTHPDDDHEIMTYANKNEAIGEAMTSLRDHFDNHERYHPVRD